MKDLELENAWTKYFIKLTSNGEKDHEELTPSDIAWQQRYFNKLKGIMNECGMSLPEQIAWMNERN